MTISKIYIHQDIADYPLVATVCDRIHHLPVHIVQDPRAVYEPLTSTGIEGIQGGKEVLSLTRNKGAFVKECPGTREYACCCYKILHIGTFWTMDCSYCILQAYFHPPVLQFIVNRDDLLSDLNELFNTPGIHRVGAGEFTDSMIWEPWTDTSQLLVPAFAKQHRAVLELKSKTIAMDASKPLEHNRKTICAWSLNTPKVIKEEERRTAFLQARFEAAATCEAWGYPLAFHFDPMVIYDGCEKEYESVIHALFSHVRPESVVWISLGTFQFIPALKPNV